MEVHRLDLNDFSILKYILHDLWGYLSPGILSLDIHSTHWNSSLERGICYPQKAVLHLGTASSRPGSLPYQLEKPQVVGSAWGSALIFCPHIHSEPSMPGYQLLPKNDYC